MLLIRLGTHALTPSVAGGGKLVEDVLQLILVVAVLREEGEVEHGSEPNIIVVLLVCGMALVVGLVVHCVVDSLEVVLHIAVGAILVGVVKGGEQTECSSTEHPTVVEASR